MLISNAANSHISENSLYYRFHIELVHGRFDTPWSRPPSGTIYIYI